MNNTELVLIGLTIFTILNTIYAVYLILGFRKMRKRWDNILYGVNNQ